MTDQERKENKNIEIKDTSGNVLYSTPRVRGMTKIKFLKSLIEAGIKDFSNIHFEGYNFRSVNPEDFSDLIFDGSTIKDCEFDGKILLKGTSFKNCNITNTSFAGIEAHTTIYFDGSTIKDSFFNNARAKYISFKGCEIHNVEARDARFTHMDASFANITKVDWTRSFLKKTIWDYSHVIRNTFNDCIFESAAQPDHQKNVKSIRSNGAIFAGSKAKNIQIPKRELNQLKWDKNINRIGRAGLSMAAIGAFFLLDYQFGVVSAFSDFESETLKQISKEVGSLGAFVGIYSAITFTKDYLVNKVSSNLLSVMDRISIATREFANGIAHYGKNIKNMVVAVGKTKDLTPIIKSMETVKKSKHPLLKPIYAAQYILSPTKKECFIVADREHLAEALEMISYNRQDGMNIPRDIVLLKEDKINDNIPSCIRFHKNGETTVLWEKDKQLDVGVIYDAHGEPKKIIDYNDNYSDLSIENITHGTNLLKATAAFERHILNQNDLWDIEYDHEKRYIESRTDGGFAIKNKNVKNIGNTEYSPALITPEREESFNFGQGKITGWKRDYYKNGKHIMNPFEILNTFENVPYNSWDINEFLSDLSQNKDTKEEESKKELKI